MKVCYKCGKTSNDGISFVLNGNFCLFCKRAYSKIYYREYMKRGIHKGRPTHIDRFWSNVKKSNDKDGCWIWTGHRKARPLWNYGYFGINGKQVLAHRFSYELHYGSFPQEYDCCHKCDNPPCVRPDHLFLGTNNDNIRDSMSKGRRRGPITPCLGEKHHMSKFTTQDIEQIFIMHSNGMKGKDIALYFFVSTSTISEILNRKRWKHVTLPQGH